MRDRDRAVRALAKLTDLVDDLSEYGQGHRARGIDCKEDSPDARSRAGGQENPAPKMPLGKRIRLVVHGNQPVETLDEHALPGHATGSIALGKFRPLPTHLAWQATFTLQRLGDFLQQQCVIVAGDLVLRTYEGIEVGAMATSGWIAVESQRTLFRLQVDRGRQCVFSDF